MASLPHSRRRGHGSSPGLLVLAVLVVIGIPLAALAALLTLLVGGHFLTNLGLVAAGALALVLLGLLVAALRQWLGRKK